MHKSGPHVCGDWRRCELQFTSSFMAEKWWKLTFTIIIIHFPFVCERSASHNVSCAQLSTRFISMNNEDETFYWLTITLWKRKHVFDKIFPFSSLGLSSLKRCKQAKGNDFISAIHPSNGRKGGMRMSDNTNFALMCVRNFTNFFSKKNVF